VVIEAIYAPSWDLPARRKPSQNHIRATLGSGAAAIVSRASRFRHLLQAPMERGRLSAKVEAPMMKGVVT